MSERHRPVRAAIAPVFFTAAFTWCAGSTSWGAAVPRGDTGITSVRVASGLVEPVFVTHAPGDLQRLFIIERPGRIRILRAGAVLPESFLDIDALTMTDSEQGLLGMAFDPAYGTTGAFYVSYTDLAGDSIIARYQVSADPDVASTAGDIILKVDQPYPNHKGGWIGFGPDGFLYVAFGDGGAGCDPEIRAQDLQSLLGKILRLDVGADAFPADKERDYAIPAGNPFIADPGLDEIWALGLRNPWRSCFDRVTGDLYIADVGEATWEEVNFQASGSAGGANYGWDCMEGSGCASVSGCGPGGCLCGAAALTPPIHEYGHTQGLCSITGGCVYRGSAIADLQGTYFFGDFCQARTWSFRVVGGVVSGGVTERTLELAPGGGVEINVLSSFGEDAAGELYICDLSGEVFKIVARPPTCAADLSGDGVVGSADLAMLLGGWGAAGAGDLNGDGVVGSEDMARLLGSWGACA